MNTPKTLRSGLGILAIGAVAAACGQPDPNLEVHANTDGLTVDAVTVILTDADHVAQAVDATWSDPLGAFLAQANLPEDRPFTIEVVAFLAHSPIARGEVEGFSVHDGEASSTIAFEPSDHLGVDAESLVAFQPVDVVAANAQTPNGGLILVRMNPTQATLQSNLGGARAKGAVEAAGPDDYIARDTRLDRPIPKSGI